MGKKKSLLRDLTPVERERVMHEARISRGFRSDDEYREWVSREAEVVEQIRWVAKYLEIDGGSVEAIDAPCAEAWGMLVNYRKSPEQKEAFWKEMYSKLVPNRAQLEGEAPIKVDGQHIIDAVDRMREMLGMAQPNVSASDPREGGNDAA